MKIGPTFAMAAVCLLVGFALGRTTAPIATHDEESAHRESSSGSEHPESLASGGEESDATVKAPPAEVAANERAQPVVSAEHAGARPEMEEEAVAVAASAVVPDYDAAMALLALVEVALEDGDAEALRALAEPLALQAEFVVPELAALLEDADSLFAKEHLAQLLGATGDPEALPLVQDLLRNEENDEVRTAAIRALGEIPDASSVPLLRAEFARTSDSPMPPSLAASSLGKIGTDDAVSALQMEVKEGTNRMVQSFALRALAELQDPDLIPFFLEQARRKEGASERFRKSAIDAIGQTGDESAIRQLEQIVSAREESQALRESAMRAINKLAGEPIYDIR